LWFAVALLGEVAAGAHPFAAEAPPERLKQCGVCHGEDGNAQMEKMPSLAGQPELYLTNQLILMREGVRRSDAMAPFVKGLSDEEIIALSAHISKLTARASTEPVDRALSARGADIAAGKRCASCHRPDYTGQEQIPRLALQRIDYLIERMTAFRDGAAKGGDTLMADAMRGLSDEDVRALAPYFASMR
jgi:cytochrome c553